MDTVVMDTDVMDPDVAAAESTFMSIQVPGYSLYDGEGKG